MQLLFSESRYVICTVNIQLKMFLYLKCLIIENLVEQSCSETNSSRPV